MGTQPNALPPSPLERGDAKPSAYDELTRPLLLTAVDPSGTRFELSFVGEAKRSALYSLQHLHAESTFVPAENGHVQLALPVPVQPSQRPLLNSIVAKLFKEFERAHRAAVVELEASRAAHNLASAQAREAVARAERVRLETLRVERKQSTCAIAFRSGLCGVTLQQLKMLQRKEYNS